MFEIPEEIAGARRALDIAENQFNWVTERDHGRYALDSGIYTVTAAALKLQAAVARTRAEAVENPRARKAS